MQNSNYNTPRNSMDAPQSTADMDINTGNAPSDVDDATNDDGTPVLDDQDLAENDLSEDEAEDVEWEETEGDDTATDDEDDEDEDASTEEDDEDDEDATETDDDEDEDDSISASMKNKSTSGGGKDTNDGGEPATYLKKGRGMTTGSRGTK